MRFLGLPLEDRVPDAKTVWLFRERLKALGLVDVLFARLNEQLAQRGYVAKAGPMIDATCVEAPRQRNSRAENAPIKAGELPDGWDDPEQAAQRRQKDTDARWTQKNDETHYGYKNPINADAQLIQDYAVTPANVHDSPVVDDLLDTATRPPKTANARFTPTAPIAPPNGKPIWRNGVWRAKFMKRARVPHH